ncbi:11722_t:CDS:2 [Ambispora gerdemannii]|uniref:11722_t:CDS:1 n=1 Tax=Ambispora gerdemannii TaxID=144530 RepID=A0A9N9GA34_9GLOM|nr:11722_t:CDS:2 [Ambispora gerdemannii]
MSQHHNSHSHNNHNPNATAAKNLKHWWKQFTAKNAPVRKGPDGKGKGARAIFGVELADAIEHASVPICMAGPDGRQYVYGYIPTIVAKCGMFLKQEAITSEGIFRLNGSAKRIKELQAIFDAPPSYGKTLTWVGYSVHDAANILRRYLNHLPDPVIPQKRYEEFRLVIDLLAVFSSKSEQNLMTSKNLASIFQPEPPNLNNPTPVRKSTRRSSFSLERNDNGDFEPVSPDSPRPTNTDFNNNNGVERASTLGRSKTLPTNRRHSQKRNTKRSPMTYQLSSGSLISMNTIRSGDSRATGSGSIRFEADESFSRPHPKRSNSASSPPVLQLRTTSSMNNLGSKNRDIISNNNIEDHQFASTSSSPSVVGRRRSRQKRHPKPESIHTSPSNIVDDHKENESVSPTTNSKRISNTTDTNVINNINPISSVSSSTIKGKEITTFFVELRKKIRLGGISNSGYGGDNSGG